MIAMKNSVDYYIVFIFIIKILFAITAAIAFYLAHTKKNEGAFYEDIVYWRDRFEFIFVACVSTLIIYFFNPRNKKPLDFDFETKLLFFIYGWIVLIKANWQIFLGESYVLHAIQKII
jgi:hypothetical protein